jgi:transcriptional regulator with XRE-family HTH domain
MDVRHILAANVVRLRRAKGLTQEALGWDAGVSRSYMAKIETGKTWTGLEIMDKFAKILDCEPYELLMPPPRRGRRNG